MRAEAGQAVHRNGSSPHPAVETGRPAAGSFVDNVDFLDALEAAFTDTVLTEGSPWKAPLAVVWSQLDCGCERSDPLPLQDLCRIHGLDPFDRTVVALALVFAVSSRFREACREVRLFQKGLQVGAVLEFLCPDRRERFRRRAHFAAGAPLIREGILDLGRSSSQDEPDDILNETLRLPGRILNLLQGDRNVYSAGSRVILREKPQVSWDSVVLPAETKAEMADVIDNLPSLRGAFGSLAQAGMAGFVSPVVFLSGWPGTGKTLLAKAIASRLGKELFTLDLGKSRQGGFESALRLLYREARLSGGIVFFDECHKVLEPDSDEGRALLIEVERSGCLTILATNRMDDIDPAIERRALLKLDVPYPERAQRKEILARIVSASGIALAPDVDLDAVARLYPFSGGDLQNLVALALIQAVRKAPGRQPPHIDWADLDVASDIVHEGKSNPLWEYVSPRIGKGKPKIPPWLEPARRMIEAYLETRVENGRKPAKGWMDSPGLAILVRGVVTDKTVEDLWLLSEAFGVGNATTWAQSILRCEFEGIMRGKKSRPSIDDLFDAPSLVYRFCRVLDGAWDLSKALEAPSTDATVFGKILKRIWEHKGIVFLVSPASNLSPEARGKFHLVLDPPEVRAPSSLEIWEGYARDGWPVTPEAVREIARLPIHPMYRETVAYRAWLDWAAKGGRESGQGISMVDVERAWKTCFSGSSRESLFGGKISETGGKA